jgi:hypothetical protein
MLGIWGSTAPNNMRLKRCGRQAARIKRGELELVLVRYVPRREQSLGNGSGVHAALGRLEGEFSRSTRTW